MSVVRVFETKNWANLRESLTHLVGLIMLCAFWHLHDNPKRRIWRKMYIGIDEETLEVRTVGVTTSKVGDVQLLFDFMDQISPNQDTGSVTADGAYDIFVT